MKIRQKKSGNEHTFDFGEHEVNVWYKDKSGSGDVDIDYAVIPEKTSTQIERNDWLRNVGLLWLLIGGLQVGFALLNAKSLAGTGFWALLGAICLVAYRLRQVKYTVLRTDQGSIFVIDDKNHDRVFEELTARKRKRLLELYGEIDPANDPNQEIEKFRWLEKRGAITQEDLALKVTDIKRNVAGPEGDSEDVLH